ncbi:MAG: tetratricopeptide repeat protein [Rubrivivax sp.]|nr:tetratricopeptide repeat protein [Rubrivivax sp.]
MRLLSLLFTVLLLAGCASVDPPELKHPLLADELFGPPSVRASADDVFALDDAMRAYVRREVLAQARSRGLVPALTDALYTRGQLSLEYDSARTRNAREAFEARSGNCLSLVIMTAAVAREVGLEVRFNTVPAEESWERSGDLYLFVGHVNLSIGPRAQLGGWYSGTSEWVTIDFLPVRDGRRVRTQSIDESRIVAMFMNNRAAEALAAGRLDDAYAWARAAVLQDRRFWTSYNTLGVVYQKRGAYPQAEAVFRTALAAEPGNVHVLGNLVLSLQRQGRGAEADVYAAELRRLQPVAPFALFREGQLALQAGDYRRAARLFERELDHGSDYHEFHFWLAVALWNLGETRSAREHLEKAIENSTTREQTAIYAGKLKKINAARAQVPKGS